MGTRRHFLRVVALSVALLGVSRVSAQDVGDASDALPGLHRLQLAAQPAPRASVGLSGGYGYTGALLGQGEAHHRASGTVAASIQPLAWLAFGLRFDGRYDTQSGGVGNGDDGFVGDPRLAVRAVGDLGGGLRLGGALSVWVPGGAAPSLAFEATTPELTLLAAWSPPGSALTLGANVGGRFDQSSKSLNATQLSPSDVSQLGLSQWSAVLVGLGAAYRLEDVALWGEWTWDVLVGDGAPSVRQSPMRVSAGARWFPTPDVQLQALLEVSLAEEAPVDALRLVPNEPRVSAHLGAVFAFPFEARRAATETEAEVAEVPIVGAPDGATRTVRGRVLGPSGPIAGAQVRAEGSEEPVATTASDGSFELAVPESARILEVRAEGFDAGRIEVTPDGAGEVTLRAPLPAGQIRGTVQSFRGGALAARVVVQPGDHALRSGDDGSFELDVPPGEYEVEVSAPGHTTQRRHVTVELNGVTVLNIDLRRAP